MRKTRPSFFDRRPGARTDGASRVLLGLALFGSGALVGCGAACDTSDDNNAPERYVGGTAANGVYESSPWKSELLPFPGGKQYQLVHHLGFTPAIIEIFVAFGPDGERVATCAGNSCLIRCEDDELVWIKNDTCTEFWVRVTAAERSNDDRGRSCTGGSIDAGEVFDAASENEAPSTAPEGSIAGDP